MTRLSIKRLILVIATAVSVEFSFSTAHAEDNTVTLCDGGSRIIPSRLVIGRTGTSNALIVTGGARVESLTGEIGLAGSYNHALVSGSGSAWSNQCPFKVGGTGGWNQLVIAEGGSLANHTMAVIGDNTGIPGNSIVVTDPGSVWNNHGGLTIGWGGRLSSLVVSNGAHVFNTHGVVGRDTAAVSNVVVVSGSGSLWQNDGVLMLGVSGAANRLQVFDQGVVTATSLCLFSPSNWVEINGGFLLLTNSPKPAVFDPTLAGAPWRKIAFSNALQLEQSATLSFELNSSDAGDARPFILVNGAVTLDGDLVVRLADGSPPPPSAIFTLIKYANVNGAFHNALPGERITTSDHSGSFRVVMTDSLLQLTDFQPSHVSHPDSPTTRVLASVPTSKPATELNPSSYSEVKGAMSLASIRGPALPTLRCVLREGVLGVEFIWSPNRIYRLWYSTNLQTWTEVAAPAYQFPAPDTARWNLQPAPSADGATGVHVFRLSIE